MHSEVWRTPTETSLPINRYTWRTETDADDVEEHTIGTLVVEDDHSERILYAPVVKRQFKILNVKTEEFDDYFMTIAQATAVFSTEDGTAPREPLDEICDFSEVIKQEDKQPMTLYASETVRERYKKWMNERAVEAADIRSSPNSTLQEAALLTVMQHPQTFLQTVRSIREGRSDD